MSLLQVSATDVDEGLNGKIRFGITSGDENQDFLIDEDSGVIRLAKGLNFERKQSYTLTITAEDFGEDVIYAKDSQSFLLILLHWILGSLR